MSASQNDTGTPRFPRGRRPKYDAAKREEAVRLRDNTNLTLTAIAETIKVPYSTVYGWLASTG